MAEITTKEEFLNSILKEAAENPEFREKLLKDPKAAFESKLNFKLPEDFEIAVHQDTPAKLNIVLPLNSEELSEAELAAISGGDCWFHSSGCGLS